jgi:hypothetical protein
VIVKNVVAVVLAGMAAAVGAMSLCSAPAWQATAAGAQRGGGFRPAPGSPLAIRAGILAIADLNGDRIDDLLACQESALEVYFGRREGSWQVKPDRSTKVGMSSSEVAVGDLNRDGHIDVALAHHDSYNVAVLLGHGDGTFEHSPGSPVAARGGTSPHTHGLVIADVNGDGNPDLVTANSTDNDISLLLGDGTGGFRMAERSPFRCGKSPYPIASVDLNGDGCADVLIPSSARDAKTLDVLLGSKEAELGPAPGSPVTCETTVWYVATGDLNGDGRPDGVAVHGEGHQGATILINTNGTLRRARQSPLSIGAGAWGVAIADMNGDGNADLVVAANTAIRVFHGDGTGSFLPQPPTRTGKGAWRLAVGDLNGDGKLDVATRCVEADRIEVFLGS